MQEQPEHIERANRRIKEHSNKATNLELRLARIVDEIQKHHHSILDTKLNQRQRESFLGLLYSDVGDLARVGSELRNELEQAHILTTYLETYESLK